MLLGACATDEVAVAVPPISVPPVYVQTPVEMRQGSDLARAPDMNDLPKSPFFVADGPGNGGGTSDDHTNAEKPNDRQRY